MSVGAERGTRINGREIQLALKLLFYECRVPALKLRVTVYHCMLRSWS